MSSLNGTARDVRKNAALATAKMILAKELAGEHWDGMDLVTKNFYARMAADPKRNKRLSSIYTAILRKQGLL